MAEKWYDQSVFVNCPNDEDYRPLFRAVMFAVLRCGYTPRCAIMEDDASDIRINKIRRLIEECRLGIHDLSRTGLDKRSHLPRFNMPLELGLFLAAKWFGSEDHRRKDCLIFEEKSHSYEKFISDIKGQDIHAHGNDPRTMVTELRNWLASKSQKRQLPGGHAVWKDYEAFQGWLPEHCSRCDLREPDLTPHDYDQSVRKWMERNRK